MVSPRIGGLSVAYSSFVPVTLYPHIKSELEHTFHSLPSCIMHMTPLELQPTAFRLPSERQSVRDDALRLRPYGDARGASSERDRADREGLEWAGRRSSLSVLYELGDGARRQGEDDMNECFSSDPEAGQ